MAEATNAQGFSRLRIRVTWEMSRAAAEEAVLRAGGARDNEEAILGVMRRSRHAALVRSGAAFGSISELQQAGYRVVSLEIVEKNHGD